MTPKRTTVRPAVPAIGLILAVTIAVGIAPMGAGALGQSVSSSASTYLVLYQEGATTSGGLADVEAAGGTVVTASPRSE